MKTFYSLSAFVLITALSACSTIKVDHENLNNVKRVAVVGMEIIEEDPNQEEALSMGNSARQSSNELTKIYKDFINRAKRNTKWQVIDHNRVVSNSYYQKLFNSTMKGIRSLPPPGKNREVFVAPGLLDHWAVFKMTAEQKNELAKKLGVDALMVLQIRSDLNRQASFLTLAGGGRYVPDATAFAQLYYAQSSSLVWDEKGYGKSTKDGAKHIAGVIDSKKLNELRYESTGMAFEELLKKLKK